VYVGGRGASAAEGFPRVNERVWIESSIHRNGTTFGFLVKTRFS
jgi:hypothetical protein